MVGSGDGGFYCVGCPKLFPPPSGKRSLTAGDVHAARAEAEKRSFDRVSEVTHKRGGPTVRAPLVVEYGKRQSADFIGPGYDGSQGVDSEDISGIPDIDYSVRVTVSSR